MLADRSILPVPAPSDPSTAAASRRCWRAGAIDLDDRSLPWIDSGSAFLIPGATLPPFDRSRSGEAQMPKPVRVGLEANRSPALVRAAAGGVGHELWIGDSGKIRASEVRKQKTDQRDAQLPSSRGRSFSASTQLFTHRPKGRPQRSLAWPALFRFSDIVLEIPR